MRRLLILLYVLQLGILVLPIGHFRAHDFGSDEVVYQNVIGYESPITYVLLILYLCCILVLTWKRLHKEISNRNKSPEDLALTLNIFPFVLGLVFAYSIWNENIIAHAKSTPGIGIILSVLLSLAALIFLVRYRFRSIHQR